MAAACSLVSTIGTTMPRAPASSAKQIRSARFSLTRTNGAAFLPRIAWIDGMSCLISQGECWVSKSRKSKPESASADTSTFGEPPVPTMVCPDFKRSLTAFICVRNLQRSADSRRSSRSSLQPRRSASDVVDRPLIERDREHARAEAADALRPEDELDELPLGQVGHLASVRQAPASLAALEADVVEAQRREQSWRVEDLDHALVGQRPRHTGRAEQRRQAGLGDRRQDRHLERRALAGRALGRSHGWIVESLEDG